MKHRRFVYILIAILLVVASLQHYAAAQDESGSPWEPVTGLGNNGPAPTSESLDFETDLYTGKFTYSVPIKVAPARHGTQPSVALRYNSGLGNGWCGVGWDLNIGYIQRDTRHGVPIPWGTTNALTQYDDSKGFVAVIKGANARLVRVSPTNQNPIVYRQQVDHSFITYNYYTNNYWIVIDNNGTSFYFGETSASQMENSKTGWTANAGASTFRWALDKVTTANGDQAIFSYLNDGGMLYLTNISYNANTNAPNISATHTVDFILTNRSDTNISFLSGYRVTTKKLLAEIDSKESGTNVCKYQLQYISSPSTMRSLLSQVTEFGSDYSTTLPPITFNYQVQPFQFGAPTNWGTVSGQGYEATQDWWGAPDATWQTVDGETTYEAQFAALIDINGDGLPDRVMRDTNSPVRYWVVQLNTGSGFGPTNIWNSLQSSVTNDVWNSINSSYVLSNTRDVTFGELIDINGDGLPDRVMRNASAPYNQFVVQLNNGNNYAAATNWGPVNGQGLESSDDFWGSPSAIYGGAVCEQLIDMNGDGLPDRVVRSVNSPATYWEVQLNTGSGFGTTNLWNSLQNPYDNDGWFSLSGIFGDSGMETYVELIDINGDGLPDRVMRSVDEPYDRFYVQFNNGTGFEPMEEWGPVNGQGQEATQDGWGAPEATWQADDDETTFNEQYAALIDVNGDGLPDRVMRNVGPPVSYWIVQLNTGSGFGPTNIWNSLQSPVTNDAWNSVSASYEIAPDPNAGESFVELVDINGDGLPDRVMRKASAPYNQFVVQLNQGPFPDLLSSVSNGIGGSMQVSYAPSTSLDNGDSAHTRGLLPFNIWVVSQTAVYDGMGNATTNKYVFSGGYYNSTERELRGFSQVTMTDASGVKTTTYFHQSGGRDNSALGEYLDPGTESKKGIPFRTEVVGNDGNTNKITLNKVVEAVLNTNGWYFPFVAQTLEMDYEGLASYRATAKQYSYDTNSGNLIATADLGEVTNIIATNQSFTDIGGDSLYTWISYATNLGAILNRPFDTLITSDNAGSVRLRETLQFYDGKGRMTTNQSWLDSVGAFVTTVTSIYDQYGNPISSTDAAGITTTNLYDPAYEQYTLTSVTGSFTNGATYDARFGTTITSTDAKGLVSSNVIDVFNRPTATYISTNAFGAANLWKSRIFYSSGGISGGISYNCVHKQVNDAVDTTNGYETYLYADGLGRSVETRSEAETGQFRVANSLYDSTGHSYFQTLTYFSAGTNFTVLTGTNLGTLTEYDMVERPFRVTGSVQAVLNSSGQLLSTSATSGDSGSPVGATTTAYIDGSNPWGKVVTDALGNVTKSYSDAYGRTTSVLDVTTNGNIATQFKMDLLGNPTNIVDQAGNTTVAVFDSFGRKTSVTDPDMGTWSYAFDVAGRMTQQTDARGDSIKLYYSDQLGRLTAKEIYNSANHLVGTISYVYDLSDDTNYSVFKGQLYKVMDLQGYERSGYDLRGRTTKSGRFFNINGMEYTTQYAYDDADRFQELTYPGNAATIQYTYDTAGNIGQVKSIAGTGTTEIFYAPQGFNELGQMISYTNGNGVTTSNGYYANSKRTSRVQVIGTNGLQDLSYTYDAVGNIKSIVDGINTGSASATVTNIAYDQLYRLTSLNSTAQGTKTYAYNAIGNILTNQDFGSSAYLYGAKPHAVTNANGTSYAYDACGNMTTRGSQTLTYDEQNQLTLVQGTNLAVAFGYDDNGERLWRNGTNGYTIWIGGIYEINAGKVLCHVVADGRIVATFEPQCNALMSKVFGERHWYLASNALESALDWPFQKGREFWTVFFGTWIGIISLCLVARRGTRLTAAECRRAMRPSSLWRQAVTVCAISLVLTGGIRNADAATYSPVFYYYHSNHLGSTNVLTDRSGSLVQHYEYATYGQITFTANGSAFPVSNLYTGQINDDETGLYYYGARYYDPQLGRFIQADSEVADPGDSQSLNRYCYAYNNPLRYTDPTGHDGTDSGDTSAAYYSNVDEGYLEIAPSQSTLYFTQSARQAASDEYYANTPPLGPYYGQTSYFSLTYHFPGDDSNVSAQPPDRMPAATSSADAVGGGGDSLLSLRNLTNFAGYLSMLPPPVGPTAGVLNAAGEFAQHNYIAGGVALGGAGLAFFGLGFVAKLGKEAAAIKAAEDAEMVYHGTTSMQTVTTKGLSAIERDLAAGSRDLADVRGFSTTTDKETARIWAEARATERGGSPVVLEAPRSALPSPRVRPGEALDLNEFRIDVQDYHSVGPGVFKISPQ